MSAAVRKRITDPTVTATAAAHAVMDSVLNAMSQQLMQCGFADGLEVGEDRELRRVLWSMVLRRIDMRRDPRVSVVATAISRAPESPTRAQALIASGLLDVAKGIEGLAKTLTRSIVDELNGYASEAVVCSAIRRGIVDLFNSQSFYNPCAPAAIIPTDRSDKQEAM